MKSLLFYVSKSYHPNVLLKMLLYMARESINGSSVLFLANGAPTLID